MAMPTLPTPSRAGHRGPVRGGGAGLTMCYTQRSFAPALFRPGTRAERRPDPGRPKRFRLGPACCSRPRGGADRVTAPRAARAWSQPSRTCGRAHELVCRPAVTASDAAGAEVAGAVGGYSVSVYVNTVSTAKIDETTFLFAPGSLYRAALTADAEARNATLAGGSRAHFEPICAAEARVGLALMPLHHAQGKAGAAPRPTTPSQTQTRLSRNGLTSTARRCGNR